MTAATAPKITVVIPTRNKKEELRRCLPAVLSQELAGDFEVLVCDDGSSDGTAEMVHAWSKADPRVRCLRQAPAGPAAARNLGIGEARAALVAMTDDDTIPQPGWLAALYEAAAQPGAVGAEGRVTTGRTLTPTETAPTNESGGVYLTCNAIYRREALIRVGGFDERFPLAAFEDCDLAAKLRQHGGIVWAPQAVVVHPPRALTWRHILRRLRHWPAAMVTARRYGYIGWPRYPTQNPRARVLWNAIFKLPAGRLLTALRALPSFPGAALRASLWALAEPVTALAVTLPEVLRFDLESAAFQLDYVNLSDRCPRVGVVIVHHQQHDLLAVCLRSLQDIDYSNLDTVIVDSGSDAAQHERLRAQFPDLDWVLSTQNVGYSEGNNLGIERLLDRGCEYFLLLNADTECCAPDFVGRLVRFLDLNPRVALAGPRVYLRRRGEVQNTILRYPSLFRNLVDWFGFRLFPALYCRSGDRVRQAEMLNGVCVMLRAAAIRQVGAFDPQYFMYVEDADLGLRLRRSGWQLAYVPFDSIIHHQKETGYGLESLVSLLIRRNAVYFLRKHHRQVQAWGLAAANVILSVARACASTSAETFRNRLAFSRALWREFRTVLRAAE